MAVPAGDERDWKFAKHFNIEIPSIFQEHDSSQSVNSNEKAILQNSEELNGLSKI